MDERETNDDRDDDGLHRDPDARKAAVAAQFDDALAEFTVLMTPRDIDDARGAPAPPQRAGGARMTTKNPHAVALGRLGGKAAGRSPAKAEAARENGKLGGRPKAARTNTTKGDDMTDTETDEQRATRLLDQFKADVARLALSDLYARSPHVVITGLLEVAAGLMRRGLRLEPAALPVLLSQIDHMRAIVQRPITAPGATPVGPFH